MPPVAHLFCFIFLSILSPRIFAFENLLLAKGEVRKDLPAVPLRFASPDWHVYHTTNHLHLQIHNLSRNCPAAHVSLNLAVPSENALSDSPSSPDKHVPLLELDQSQFEQSAASTLLSSASNGLLYVTIRAKSTKTASRARQFASHLLHRRHNAKPTTLVFVFGEEGRDLLTPEIALTVLQQACGVPTSNATEQSEQIANRLVEGVELVLVPLLNPDGRRIAEMGRRCDRTNANDVAIDRNFPSFWGHSTVFENAPPDTKPEKGLRAAVARRLSSNSEHHNPHYMPPSGGTHPFSEPESRALRAIVQKFQPASYVSVRTGAVALTVPWDCKPGLLSDEQQAKLLRVTKSIAASHCSRCKTGNLYNVTGHLKCGTATDYMYGTLHIPFVHTWHVYSLEAPKGDCFRRHNPTAVQAFKRISNNWANAVFNFTTAVHNWMELEHLEGLDAAERNASRSADKAVVDRKEAMARGIPDPELEEHEHSKQHDENSAGNAAGAGVKAGLFHWMRDSNGSETKTANETASNVKSEPSRGNATGDRSGNDEISFLSGWWGIWAAMMLLGMSFFVAKRHIFGAGRRRGRFKSRTSMKSA